MTTQNVKERPLTKKKGGFKWGYLIMGIIIFILLGVVGFLFQGGESDKQRLARLERNAVIDKQTIGYYQNELGQRIAEIEAKQYANSKELKEFEASAFERIQEIAGNVKDVSEYIKFYTSVVDSMRVEHKGAVTITDNATGEKIDSLPFKFNDSYMKLKGKVTSTDVYLDYKYTPSYEVVASWKKPEGAGMFDKKRLMVNIVPENPNELVTDASAIEVNQPKLKFYETKAFWASLSYILGIGTKFLIKE
jgi:hypothetical protein